MNEYSDILSTWPISATCLYIYIACKWGLKAARHHPTGNSLIYCWIIGVFHGLFWFIGWPLYLFKKYIKKIDFPESKSLTIKKEN